MRTVLFMILIFLVFSLVAFSATLHVPSQYPNIQAGIYAASNGDTVLVAPGTYVESINFKGKAIIVKSRSGAGVTIIDGNQSRSVVTFNSGEGAGSLLNGFTVTNGSGNPNSGGGIYCNSSSPIIMNNTITENSTDYGGGIYCERSSPNIKNNIITDNKVDGCGAGICCMSFSNPIITNNTFFGNLAAYHGGGIDCWDNSSPIITNNTISKNMAECAGGGGIYCYDSSAKISNNAITGNSAKGQYGCGGGISCLWSSLTIMNNAIADNLADDYGGGIRCDKHSSMIITNTIIWNNTALFQGPEIWIGNTVCPSRITISYSDVKGGKSSVYVYPGCTLNWGPGMIDADPLFVDPANGDFHLTYPSPCKDTGDNTAVTAPEDFEGAPRIAYGTVDMGADEFYTHLYWTGDATPGGNVEIKFVGLPGTTPVQLWLGSGVMDPALPTKYGDWYLQFPLLANVGLGAIPTPGVYVLPFTFPPDTPTPLSLPFQAGIGAELTNLCVLKVE